MHNNRHSFVLTERTYKRELIPDLHQLEAKADNATEERKREIWEMSTVIRQLICDNSERLRRDEDISEPMETTRKTIFNALSWKNKNT